jgi:hypothetical protein
MGEKAGTSVGGRMWGKRVGGKIRHKKCVHIHVNAKMILIETVPGIREERIKESSGGSDFKYDISGTL